MPQKIKMFLKKTRKYLFKHYQVKSEDIILASYPRSGNTWMRVILAEMLFGDSGTSLKDLQNLIPDIHHPILLKKLIPTETHIIKSHLPRRTDVHDPIGLRNIYLIRDPRDVVISYYHFVMNLRYYRKGFNDFCLDWLNGRIWPCSWREHVCSWAGQNSGDLKWQVIIRYEDLLTEFSTQITKISKQFNRHITPEEIDRIKNKSSIHAMRVRENLGVHENENSDGYNLIRNKKTTTWRDALTQDQIRLIEENIGDLIREFGYPLTN